MQPRLSPFALLPDELRSAAEEDFLTFFRLAVTTTDADEEGWAYRQLADVHAVAIAGMNDYAPSLLDAMKWAAGQPPATAAAA